MNTTSRGHRRVALATLTALSLPLAAAVGAPASYAAPAAVCDGLPATIVAPEPTGPTGPPVVGTPGDDVIVGSSGDDAIDGAGGNDVICGLAGADTIIGGTGDDRIFAGGDQDHVPDEGYHGDRVRPGPGDDHVDLGHDPRDAAVHGVDHRGTDTVSFSEASGPVEVDLGAGTATGEGNDTIAVPITSAAIIGSPHADRLVGHDGGVMIVGGGGDDVLVGGRGPDDFFPDGVGDTVTLGPPQVTAPVPGDDVVRARGGEDFVRSELGVDVVHGGSGEDRLVSDSTSGGGKLRGGPGDDELEAESGTALLGGRGWDRVSAHVNPGAPEARLDAGPGGNYVIVKLRRAFEAGMKVLVHVPKRKIVVNGERYYDYTGSRSLLVGARGGYLTFVGGRRGESLSPGAFREVRAFGGGGADLLRGSNRRDVLVGGPGRDELRGRWGRDRLRGGSGNDLLKGSQGRDRLAGGPGWDRCRAGEQLFSCERRR